MATTSRKSNKTPRSGKAAIRRRNRATSFPLRRTSPRPSTRSACSAARTAPASPLRRATRQVVAELRRGCFPTPGQSRDCGQASGQTVYQTVSAYDFGHFCSGRLPPAQMQSAHRASQLSESRAVPRGYQHNVAISRDESGGEGDRTKCADLAATTALAADGQTGRQTTE